MAKSDRDSPIGGIACFIAYTTLSHHPALMSSRSNVELAGSTMSAKRAIGVQKISCTTIVSGFCQPRRSLLMS